MSRLNVDTLAGQTTSNIEVLSGNTIKTNTIAETTSGQGVTIDGALIKDGKIAASAGGSMVLLDSYNASTDSEKAFDNFVDTSTYISYKIYIDNLAADTDDVYLGYVFRTATPGDITGAYFRAGYKMGLNTADNAFYGNTSETNYTRTALTLGNLVDETMSGIIDFFPNSGGSQLTRTMNNYIMNTAANPIYAASDNACLVNNTQVSGIRFYMSSGNILSGTIRVYGIKLWVH